MNALEKAIELLKKALAIPAGKECDDALDEAAKEFEKAGSKEDADAVRKIRGL